MKKVALIIGSLVVLLVLSAVLIPVIFREDIQKAIDDEMNAALNARPYYDVDAFSLSLFKSFPDLTVSIGNFGIAGVDMFQEDTLLSVDEFSITVDLLSVVRGEQIKIKNVLLDRPLIELLVLEDGSANYDIVKPSDAPATDEEQASDSSGPLNIAIDQWQIINGDLIYYDQTLPFYVTLFGLDHSGSGDFAEDIFDMETATSIRQLSMGYDGDEYITDKTLNADIILGMDLANMAFTFKENTISLNEFGFGFDGSISMPGDDIGIDLTFEGKEIDLKDIISLIPGLYQEYLAGVTAGGQVGFAGVVKGTVTETDLPMINTTFSVSNGTISYAEYPIPMENININAQFDMPSADLTQTSFVMDQFSMSVDGEPLTASLLFRDLEDFYWEFAMDGNIDLEKLTKIIPMKDMTLLGKVNAAMETKGRMSDLEAEAYEKLPTSGSMAITGFQYTSPDLPQGFGIQSARAAFDPDAITLDEFRGNVGNTDLNMSGSLSNYMDYALSESGVLVGKLDFASKLVDVNEWMTDEETTGETEDTITMEVVRVPTNIDFELRTDIEALQYDNLSIRSFKGGLVIRDGAINMDQVGFDLLDGQFVMNGAYVTTTEDPTYAYDLNISDLSIPNAYQAFTTVQNYAPFASKMQGSFSTEFDIQGALGADMSPVFETIFGKGDIRVNNGQLSDVKLLAAASRVTKLDAGDGTLSLKDVVMKAEIIEGNVFIEPFDVKLGGYTTTIGGSNSLDGKLNYVMTVREVPTGAAGQAVSSALASLTGSSSLVPNKVDINLGVEGDFADPKVKLLGVTPAGSEAQSAKAALAAEARKKLEEQKQAAAKKVEEARAQVQEEVAEKKEEAKAKVEEKKEEVKDAAKKEVEEAKEEAKDKLKGLLGKKKKKKKGGGK